MYYRLFIVLLIVAMVAQFGFCAGGLSWKKQAMDLSADFGQQDVTAGFEFKNTSDHPVTITTLDTSCSCTLAELEKRTYAPGESGRIEVSFEAGDQVGLQQEYIFVATDEPQAEPVRLLLKVNIPEYLKMEPRMVFWAVGSKPVEKIITCTAQARQSITLAGAQSTDPEVAAQIETVIPGLQYRIHLKPVSTVMHVAATIHLQAGIAGVGPHVFNAYAYITGP